MISSKNFFESNDITDPTPYEPESSEMFEGEECLICGRGFRKGEGVKALVHRQLDHDRFLMHKACLYRKIQSLEDLNTILNFLDNIGFDLEDVGE